MTQSLILKRLVDDFAENMAAKLIQKSEEGWNGWLDCPIDVLQNRLKACIDKGDMIDVANYALLINERQFFDQLSGEEKLTYLTKDLYMQDANIYRKMGSFATNRFERCVMQMVSQLDLTKPFTIQGTHYHENETPKVITIDKDMEAITLDLFSTPDFFKAMVNIFIPLSDKSSDIDCQMVRILLSRDYEHDIPVLKKLLSVCRFDGAQTDAIIEQWLRCGIGSVHITWRDKHQTFQTSDDRLANKGS